MLINNLHNILVLSKNNSFDEISNIFAKIYNPTFYNKYIINPINTLGYDYFSKNHPIIKILKELDIYIKNKDSKKIQIILCYLLFNKSDLAIWVK